MDEMSRLRDFLVGVLYFSYMKTFMDFEGYRKDLADDLKKTKK